MSESVGGATPVDPHRAKNLEEQLKGSTLNGWTVGDLIGAGKAGAVFAARRATQLAALKVFDPELVERFGEATQRQRLERELSLQGVRHPHIVQILDGGANDEHHLLFVVMQRIDAVTLDQLIPTFPRDLIRPVIGQVANAARFLETRELAHRDIKPSNIAVDLDARRAILLDLGVLRPIGGSDLTDSTDAHRFVGTVRYSSPEYLVREEVDSPEAWRALTFYQLGAVLHDMIMRTRLFEEYSEPVARLIRAIETEHPGIVAEDVPPDLVLLARSCLVKDPKTRLEFVKWSQFTESPDARSVGEAAKERIVQRRALAEATGVLIGRNAEQLERDRKETLRDILVQIQGMVRSACVRTTVFPAVELQTREEPDGHAGTLEIVFPPSPQHALPNGASFQLRVQLFDIAEQGVRLETRTDKDGDRDLSEALFTGVFEPSSVKARLEEFLYVSLDKVQAKADAGIAAQNDAAAEP